MVTEVRAQLTAAMYTMREVIVWFNTWLGNISYFASGQGNRKADTDGGKRKHVCKEWESWCFSFGCMVFPLGLCLCFSFRSTSVSSFEFMSFLCSFGFAYTIIWKRRGVLRTKGQGGVVAEKSVAHHHCHTASQRTALRRVDWDTGITETVWLMGAYGDSWFAEMDGVTVSIYLGVPGVDRLNRILYHLTSSCHIQRITHSIIHIVWSHTLFPKLCMDPHNCMDPHGRVAWDRLTLFLHSSSLNCSFSVIPFGMLWEVQRSVDHGLSAF